MAGVRLLGPPPVLRVPPRREDAATERAIAAILERSRPRTTGCVLITYEGDAIVFSDFELGVDDGLLYGSKAISTADAIVRATARAHYAHESRGPEWIDLGGEA